MQIRGYPIRLNLDVCLVFSANPEDYTNRGRIVTPLKDRIGSVIRTHYPETIEESLEIVGSNAWNARGGDGSDSGVNVVVPRYLQEITEEVVRLARKSPHVAQASGVSVRTSIANAETVYSNAERRGILTGEKRVVARVCDLQHLVASCRGKIEMTLGDDDSSEDKLVQSLVGEAVKTVFNRTADFSEFEPVAENFQKNVTFPGGDEIPAKEFVANMQVLKPLPKLATNLTKEMEMNPNDEGELASVGEFILEGLYVNNRLSKFNRAGKPFFKR